MQASFQRRLLYTKKVEIDISTHFCFTRFPELSACGERGIRTPGASQLNGFQDRRNRPLCHLSFVGMRLSHERRLSASLGDRDSSSILEATSFSDDVLSKSGAKVLLFFQIHKFFIKILANMRKI